MKRVHPCYLLAGIAASVLIAFGAAMIALQSAADSINANSTDAAGEVRVAVRNLDDGRVEVAVQQRVDEGSWGDRQLPQARFLPSGVEPGDWRVSSGVPINAADAGSGPLYCMVAHGSVSDTFWREVRGYARLAADRFGMNLRFSTHQDSADQAAAVRQCSADGALAIASTIADPDQMVPALEAAQRAGARIITFNSGSTYAEAARSTAHIGLNDVKAGQAAAQQFNELDHSGLLLCVIHEERNVGLTERCDNLAAHYEGGEVEVLQLEDGDDIPTRAAKIAARLTDAAATPITGLSALNPDTLVAAFMAIEQTGAELAVISNGADGRKQSFPERVKAMHLFSINDLGEYQGYLTVAALQMMADFHHPPSALSRPVLLISEPGVSDARIWAQGANEDYSAAGERIRSGDDE